MYFCVLQGTSHFLFKVKYFVMHFAFDSGSRVGSSLYAEDITRHRGIMKTIVKDRPVCYLTLADVCCVDHFQSK